MHDWVNVVCDRIQTTLHDYWQARYQAYLTETAAAPAMPAATTPLAALAVNATTATTATTAPTAAQDAYQYYHEQLAARDRGSVTLEPLQLEGNWVYAVRAVTDGDDGWLELYDAQGTLLGAGRTYIELVAWGDRAEIRATVPTGDYPPHLDRSQTLWGQ